MLFFAMTGHRAAEIRELLRFAEADSVTLPDECTNCGGVVMVRMTEVKRHRRFITPGSWVCPYCQKVHGGEFAGRIEWVRKGHEEPSFE